ncbi:CaiB/BaiF CoA transferase family protein [Amorphus sp. 3PC139-8]|uniref:CaiB/BaiF CoA transferase family protein n=1 Tax=Amorphus sp. 3PC139-8 TaxID=2735676 RepID=UPI00345DA6EB
MKLEGIRVLDLSSFLPGPYLTLALADHGAEVIKIEAPGEGDPSRHIGPRDGPHTVFFRSVNRGKKSVALNLKDESDRAAFLRLADTADVVVESNRPGVAKRLGVDYDTIAARNPSIVYCSLSAFGQDGPYAGRAAHDLALEALSGVLSLTLGDDGRPAIPGIPIADVLAGLQGLSGVMMALYARERTGKGDFVDIAMHEALLGATVNMLGPAVADGVQPDVKNGRTTGGAAFYAIYDTADGRQIALAGQEPKFIRALLDKLGRPDLVEPCTRGPGPHQAPVRAFLADTFKAMTLAEAEAFLNAIDVCWGPVNTLPEALADPHLSTRGFVLTDAEDQRHLASPIRFRNEPARPDWRAHDLDEDSDLARTAADPPSAAAEDTR